MARRRLAALALGGALAATGSIGGVALWLGGGQGSFSLEGLPAATVRNYAFASTHSDVLSHIPCYCGCYGLGHRSLLDCYIRPDGGYDEHASGCSICGREADEVARLLQEGNDTPAVRAAIDAQFSRYGRGTTTP